MTWMTAVGAALAAGGLAVLVAAVRDCVRRPDLPSLRYGARTIRRGWLRAGWIVVLLAGWSGGIAGTEVAGRERHRPAPERPDARGGGSHSSLIRVPFYRRGWARELRPGGGGPLLVTEEAVTLPWSYLLVLLLYGVFVVWWPASGVAPTPPSAGRRGSR